MVGVVGTVGQLNYKGVTDLSAAGVFLSTNVYNGTVTSGCQLYYGNGSNVVQTTCMKFQAGLQRVNISNIGYASCNNGCWTLSPQSSTSSVYNSVPTSSSPSVGLAIVSGYISGVSNINVALPDSELNSTVTITCPAGTNVVGIGFAPIGNYLGLYEINRSVYPSSLTTVYAYDYFGSHAYAACMTIPGGTSNLKQIMTNSFANCPAGYIVRYGLFINTILFNNSCYF